MMKKMITLASLAFMLMAAPASMQAQNIVNADAKVDAKAAKKAEKERLKQEKKAAKEKAKAAKLVAKDATNAAVGTTASAITNEFKNEKPALLTAGDSTAYLFGISQSNGLKAYLVNQMNVDTAYLNTFARRTGYDRNFDRTDRQGEDGIRLFQCNRDDGTDGKERGGRDGSGHLCDRACPQVHECGPELARQEITFFH